MYKESASQLSLPQRLCLLMVPCAALCIGATLIYFAVTCNVSGGLQFDKEGDIICLRSHGGDDPSAIDTAAIVVKIVVISLIIITVAVSMTICVWFVMRKQNEDRQLITDMKNQATDIEKLITERENVYVVEKKQENLPVQV